MKIFFLICLVLTSSAHAFDVGQDKSGGNISLQVTDGPIIFTTKVVSEKMVNPTITQPFIVLSAYDICQARNLLPRFLDQDFGKEGNSFTASRSFKCTGGDDDDWKRMVKQQCDGLKIGENDATINYCNYMTRKYGPGTTQCQGKCEKVQDSTLYQ